MEVAALRHLIVFESIYKNKVDAILFPSLNPSRLGREGGLLHLDEGGRVGVKLDRQAPWPYYCI